MHPDYNTEEIWSQMEQKPDFFKKVGFLAVMT
jgi:hypothetical protein